MDIIIRNTAIAGRDGRFDILIEDDRISEVAERIEAGPGFTEIVADGLVAAPGLVDLHCHLRDPGFPHKETIETGTRAAAKGGFTAVCAMPNTVPSADSYEVIKYQIDTARAAGYCEVYPIAAVSMALGGIKISDMQMLKDCGAVAFSDDGMPVRDDMIADAVRLASECGSFVSDHCEVLELVKGGVMHEGAVSKRMGLVGITAAAEELVVERDCEVASETGCHIHIAHVSTKGSVDIVRKAKAAGAKVTAEVCPHHFAATDEFIEKVGTNAKVNPPLRGPDDVVAIIEGLVDGTIDIIATDHAPHAAEEKALGLDGAPNGISGFETALALSVTHLVKAGHMELPDLIYRMSVRPAELIGLSKRAVEPGCVADIVLFDMENAKTCRSDEFVSLGKNTPFDGMELYGWPKYTIMAGRITYDHTTK